MMTVSAALGRKIESIGRNDSQVLPVKAPCFLGVMTSITQILLNDYNK